MVVDYKSIGLQIKEKRTAVNMSQAILAELSGSSPQYISHVETGRKRISLELLVRIAHVLNTPVNILLFGNSIHESGEFSVEMENITNGCTDFEKKVILDVTAAIKASLERNRWMLDKTF